MVFDKYFSLPAAIARHQSAPLAKERERFLTHLEATGTGRSAIRIAATYMLQVISVLRLRRLRDVTLEEVDRAADHWNTLRNQGKQYPAGQSGVKCFAQTARRFLRFEGKLKSPRLPQPFSEYLRDFVEAMCSECGLSEATIRGRRNIETGHIAALGKSGLGGRRSFEKGAGLHGRSPEQRVKDAQTGAKAAVAMKRGVHAPENAGLGQHARWHLKRGRFSQTCRWCSVALKPVA
jgi:hypothetical protein